MLFIVIIQKLSCFYFIFKTGNLRNNENDTSMDMVETNRNLSVSLGKIEMRCRMLEEKNEKLRNFKVMIKNCSTLQCAHCSKFISANIFGYHLNSCQNSSIITLSAQNSVSHLNSSGFISQQAMGGHPYSSGAPPGGFGNRMPGGTPSHMNSNSVSGGFGSTAPQNILGNGQGNLSMGYVDQNQSINTTSPPIPMGGASEGHSDLMTSIQLSISQTTVRENPENSKPYTEYLIQINTNNFKWNVLRKYKAFCELHQAIVTTFPGLKPPSAASNILGFSLDMNTVLSNRRTTLIEDRRKALQQYLRDLLKVDLIKSSRVLRKFLEIDKYYDDQNLLLVHLRINSPNSQDAVNNSMNASLSKLSSIMAQEKEKENKKETLTGLETPQKPAALSGSIGGRFFGNTSLPSEKKFIPRSGYK